MKVKHLLMIFLGIVLLIFIIKNQNKVTYDNISTEEIIAKIESSFEYKNYTIKLLEDGRTVKVKDNMVVVEKDDIKLWLDYNEMTMLVLKKKEKKIVSTELTETMELFAFQHAQRGRHIRYLWKRFILCSNRKTQW